MKRLLFSRYAPFVAIVLFVVLGLAKTTHDAGKAWQNDSSTRWVEVATEWNPWLALPRPDDITAGREPVRPMREVTKPPVRSGLLLRWHSAPFACEMTNDRSAQEDGEQFASRAGSDAAFMVRAFPVR